MRPTSFRHLLIPAMTLLACPGLAQDRFQVGLGLNRANESEQSYFGSTQAYRFERATKWTPALQVGVRALDLEGSNLSVTGEYQFPVRYRNTYLAAGSAAGNEGGSTRTRFLAPGVQWNFQRQMDYGLGLQYRFTRLEGSLAGQTVTANNNRFWLTGYVGRTFDVDSPVKPFIALRGAAALSRTKAPGTIAASASADTYRSVMKHLDGRYEISLQGGVRF